MLFSSVIFIFYFLPICLLGYYLINPKFRNVFLLLMSLFFYAWGEPIFVFVMLCSIVMNHLFGLLISQGTGLFKPKAALILMLVFNLSIFFIFKYLNFTIRNINFFANDLIPQTNILLPIGISFFTFQAMSYCFDIYYGKTVVQKNPLNTALYIALFPQLIAGPIIRYNDISPELTNRNETFSDFSHGVQRFIIGLSKKVIIANMVAIIADYSFNPANHASLTSMGAWIGIICYTLQIYFDFSGYSDMAIGLGLMFGFHFKENFNYPYMARSITDFWRRWHISLGNWFRGYVYIPLGGSRVSSKGRLIFNLFSVWILTGIWHGASWNFVFWGLFYFMLLCFEKIFNIPKKLESTLFIWKLLYRMATLFFIMTGWIFFRAENIQTGFVYFKTLFSLNNPYNQTSLFLLRDNAILLLIGIIACFPVTNLLNRSPVKSFFKAVKPFILALLFIICLSYIVNGSYDPFIYFNF